MPPWNCAAVSSLRLPCRFAPEPRCKRASLLGLEKPPPDRGRWLTRLSNFPQRPHVSPWRGLRAASGRGPACLDMLEHDWPNPVPIE